MVEIPVGKDQIARIQKATDDIRRIIRQNYFPKATRYKKRCLNCTYRNVCIK